MTTLVATPNPTPTPNPAPTVFKLHAPRHRKKVAIFDYDHTLVQPKDGRPFSKDVDDWEFTSPHVPTYIKAAYSKGYMICICTQQSKSWKLEQIRKVLEPLDIPMYVSVATHKSIYKPNTAAFDAIIGTHKWDSSQSFSVGDALGRKNDWSDCDKQFALALKISYTSPEAYFKITQNLVEKPQNTRVYKPVSGSKQEVVIMTGYPGSGKSTYATQVYGTNSHYIILHGDIYKTPAKMIAAATPYIKDGKSVVFDSTNPSKKKRQIYIDFAKIYTLPITCVHISTSFEDSYARNKLRPEDAQIPRIVYNIYKKNFEMPTNDEGCSVVVI